MSVAKKSFETKSHGKWILAGEHAVLRGVPALVFPLCSRAMTLNYEPSGQALNVELDGEHGEELQLLVWGVLEKACELKKIHRSELTGSLRLKSTIPVGAGMGASAALCVVITRWLGFLGWLKLDEYYDFARTLENLFHGESSGVDIAVALSEEGLEFTRNGDRLPLKTAWTPQWYISYSGKRGVTLECVNKVKALIARDPEWGAKIDAQMKRAVRICREALQRDQEMGLPELVEGIELASKCFQEWGLIEGAPEKHMQWLKEQGALAVKPTGSGGGGYILSLWKSPPSDDVRKKLISC